MPGTNSLLFYEAEFENYRIKRYRAPSNQPTRLNKLYLVNAAHLFLLILSIGAFTPTVIAGGVLLVSHLPINQTIAGRMSHSLRPYHRRCTCNIPAAVLTSITAPRLSHSLLSRQALIESLQPEVFCIRARHSLDYL